MRATFRLSSPAWLAQPKITSSISLLGPMRVRESRLRMACPPRSSGRTGASAPRTFPTGVRKPSTITASLGEIAMPGIRLRAGVRCGAWCPA